MRGSAQGPRSAFLLVRGSAPQGWQRRSHHGLRGPEGNEATSVNIVERMGWGPVPGTRPRGRPGRAGKQCVVHNARCRYQGRWRDNGAREQQCARHPALGRSECESDGGAITTNRARPTLFAFSNEQVELRRVHAGATTANECSRGLAGVPPLGNLRCQLEPLVRNRSGLGFHGSGPSCLGLVSVVQRAPSPRGADGFESRRRPCSGPTRARTPGTSPSEVRERLGLASSVK